jgi:hypothetical protein
MRKFTVNVVRVGYSFLTIEVEAEDKTDARFKAIEEAGNREFSEGGVDYDTNEIIDSLPEEAEKQYINNYHCPDCDEEWTDVWTAMCDDECPKCGTICSPEDSQDY